ncbi:MAG: riboflavin biosynthesis protein RibF [Treponema sp.]|nr:riboflavin biosynthesis protein RibF [Treponema sp.]
MRITEWEDFIAGGGEPMAVTIGVFDGVHRGHQALIEKIGSGPCLPTVVTFRQNPLRITNPGRHVGDIFSLDQKLRAFEFLGVGQAVLIDFSGNFSKISGRDFIDRLVKNGQVRLLALGGDFRCGRDLDTGVREITEQTRSLGVEIRLVEAVTEGGRRVSSSRIRRAIGAGDIEEAERLLGGKVVLDLSGIPVELSSSTGESGCRCYDVAAAFRISPRRGRYEALVYGAGSAGGIETTVCVEHGKVVVPPVPGGDEFRAERVEFLKSTQ